MACSVDGGGGGSVCGEAGSSIGVVAFEDMADGLTTRFARRKVKNAGFEDLVSSVVIVVVLN
jgi:hypothetical protein